MPFKKKAKNGRKKVTYKRKYRLVAKTAPSGLPLQRVTNMRYNETVELTSTTGVLTPVFYRANGIYDPRVSAGGHRPMGVDTMASMYNHYTVLGSKITVRVRNKGNDGASQVPFYAGLYLTDDTTTGYTKASEFIEARKGTTRMGQWIYPWKMSNKFSAKRFFNVTDVKDNSQLSAANNADPVEQAYYCVWIQALGTGTAGQTFDVTIDYIVSWAEPKELAQS